MRAISLVLALIAAPAHAVARADAMLDKGDLDGYAV